jgi:hypothetical protein
MPVGKPKPITPLQAQMYGHVAAALKQGIQLKGWSIGDFNEAMGQKRTNTAVYGWLRGNSAPGPSRRLKLAKLFGLPVEAVTPREPGAGPGEVWHPSDVASADPQALVLHPTANKPRGRPPATALVAREGTQALPTFSFTLEGTAGPVTVQVTLGRKP